MTLYDRHLCQLAMQHIHAGELVNAISLLRSALKGTTNGRAKSKLMLAIRECNRALRAAQ